MAVLSGSGCALLAEAFGYPAPGRLEILERRLSALPEGPARDCAADFVSAIAGLSMGEWEELYTRTLDLNPLVAPYIGYAVWGESHRRGPFLGRMSRALSEVGVSAGGELPDHIAPVLRYLAACPTPLPELIEMLIPALERMSSTLRHADPYNPYVHLLVAVEVTCSGLQVKEAA